MKTENILLELISTSVIIVVMLLCFTQLGIKLYKQQQAQQLYIQTQQQIQNEEYQRILKEVIRK